MGKAYDPEWTFYFGCDDGDDDDDYIFCYVLKSTIFFRVENSI